jgi:archaellum component FlaC
MKPVYEIIGDGHFTDGHGHHHPHDDYPYTLGRKVLYQQQVIINQGNIICLADYTNEIIIIEATDTEYFLNFSKLPNRKYYVIFRALNPTVLKLPKHILFNGELKTSTFDLKIKAEEELVIEVLGATNDGKSIVLVNINGYDSNGKILDQVNEATGDISGLDEVIGKISGIQWSIDQLDTQVSGLDVLVEDLSDILKSISGFNIHDVEQSITNVTERVDSLTTIVSNNTTTISGLSEDFSALVNQVNSISGQVGTISGYLDSLTVSVNGTTILQGDTPVIEFVGVKDHTVISRDANKIIVDIDDDIFDDGEW